MRTEFEGFSGLLYAWIYGQQYEHTHYLSSDDYTLAFDHVFLMLDLLRQCHIKLDIKDTDDGDHKDEMILSTDQYQFKIRPI